MSDKILCKYHPNIPARRHCTHCDVDFCAHCAQPKEKGSDIYLCPLCQEKLEPISLSNLIVPFSERLPKFFTYPANSDSLVYTGALSVASIVALFPHKFFRLAFLLIMLAMINYAFKCLNHTARGHLSAPGVLVNYDADTNLARKQIGLFFVLFGLVGLSGYFIGLEMGIIIGLLVLLCIPAAIMILAVESRFMAAINPFKWLTLIKTVGASYFQLYGFLLLASLISGGFQTLLSSVISPYIVIIPSMFISAYFTVVMYHMMGYIIYQYHEELGFECVKGEDTERASLDESMLKKAADPFSQEIKILIDAQQWEQAKHMVKKALAREPAPKLDEQYHQLLVQTQDTKLLLKHGEAYITSLLGEGKKNLAKAMNVYVNCVKANPNYFYPNAEAAYNMAEVAVRWNKTDAALLMLNKFIQRYPDNLLLYPQAYFLAAKTLAEKKQQTGQAKKILSSVIKQFPQHELVPEVEIYLKNLKQVELAPS